MRSIVLAATLLLAAAGSTTVGFKTPGAPERLRAVGVTEDLADVLKRAFDPSTDFEPIPRPKPGDWLAVHPEPGQTFEEFVKSRPNRPGKVRKKVYLQPLGDFAKEQGPLVARLSAYAGAYFGLEVAALPSLDLEGRRVTTRINRFTKNRQVLTGDVLAILEHELPRDAFCVLAITMEDLYPDPSWNFVFGQASLRGRVGVYSFARYDPRFYGEPRGADYEQVLLRRSCRVLAHETGHMFGLLHCVYFRCVMNGSNHLEESDARPLHLCPVCLRKLQSSIGFDVADRYRQLLHFYRDTGLDAEAQWVQHRLEVILGGLKGNLHAEE